MADAWKYCTGLAIMGPEALPCSTYAIVHTFSFSQVKENMAAEAERDRELYAQRAALAEEGQELAREDRKQLQVHKAAG